MKVKSLLQQMTPLCFLPSDKLVCYRRGKLIIVNHERIECTYSIKLGKKEFLFGWNNLLSRFLRLGVRTAIALDEGLVIFSMGNNLYELDIKTGKLSTGYYCGKGVKPLIMTHLSGLKGFEDGLYYGDYLKNNDKNPVNIYHRIRKDKWDVVYTFKAGAINHVHNVIPDPYRQCVWIFTGDFDDAAAIWKATDGFKKVERVVYGNQKWRGCVAFAIPDGILYATDTPFSRNHIYLMKEDGSAKKVGDLCGSCIYGSKWKDKYVFSSTVEPDGRDESFKKLLCSKKRGSGIEDDYVRLYVGDLANGFKEVYKEKKDWLPFLFQFGAFKFPVGTNNSEILYFQPVATKEHDLKLMAIRS